MPCKVACTCLVIKSLSDFVAKGVDAHVIHEHDKASLDASHLLLNLLVCWLRGAVRWQAIENWRVTKVAFRVHDVLSVIYRKYKIKAVNCFHLWRVVVPTK